MTENARFIASSLSNLVNNFADGIDGDNIFPAPLPESLSTEPMALEALEEKGTQ